MESSAGIVAAALTMMMMVVVVSSATTTVPAFLWSPHLLHNSADDDTATLKQQSSVIYQTVSPRDLAKSLLSHAPFSDFLCSGNKLHRDLELVLVFIGNQLQSSDISGNTQTDPALVDLLQASFTRSNFSMAFPYVAASDQEIMADALVSGFAEGCGNDLGVGKTTLANLQSARDYLLSRMDDKLSKGQADLAVFGSGGLDSTESRAESHIFSELIASVEQSGAKYAVLYVSDPHKLIQYKQVERFLAEGAMDNASTSRTTCDEVCQIKASLLEGLLVGIVLLIILISGLCCMAGIDTPTRFEASQES